MNSRQTRQSKLRIKRFNVVILFHESVLTIFLVYNRDTLLATEGNIKPKVLKQGRLLLWAAFRTMVNHIQHTLMG